MGRPKHIQYTEEQAKARGLDEWRADPEKFIADLNARIRMLENAVIDLQFREARDGR